MEKIKAGDKFLCIEDVIMEDDKLVAYKVGHTYTSEYDNCITNDKGVTDHHWDNVDYFDKYFRKVDATCDIEPEKGVKNDSGKLPYYIVLFKQFPLALQEVMKCSQAGHNKYYATDSKDWQNFARVEGADIRYKNAMLRHMSETGSVKDMEEYGGMTHEAAVAWNALADLEVSLRNKNK